jgi:hypothetical protein
MAPLAEMTGNLRRSAGRVSSSRSREESATRFPPSLDEHPAQVIDGAAYTTPKGRVVKSLFTCPLPLPGPGAWRGVKP